MDAKEPLVNSTWISYLWVVGVSLWGGVTSYLEKKEPVTFITFAAHISSASFAGLMTFLLCQYGSIPGPLTGICCGVASHLGTPALIKLAMKLKIVRDFFDTSALDKE